MADCAAGGVQLDHGAFMLEDEGSDDSDHESAGSRRRTTGPLLTVGDVPLRKQGPV